jgi:hypothetical protein
VGGCVSDGGGSDDGDGGGSGNGSSNASNGIEALSPPSPCKPRKHFGSRVPRMLADVRYGHAGTCHTANMNTHIEQRERHGLHSKGWRGKR